MTALADDFTNTADVTGDDPLNNPVTDTDSADVDVIVPAISITKDPATQQAHDGDTITFTITVTNTGDVDLTGVAVTDAVAPACDTSIGDLAVGASVGYDCTMVAGAVDFTNTAEVTGNDPLGGPVSDSDSADVDIINPSILIEKGPDSQQAIAGGTVTFDITVTNNGDVVLSGVTVTDAAAPACDNVIGSLAAGASTTYSCTTTVGGGDFTNTALVTGDDPLGTPVSDSDTADVDVVNPAIDIAKNPNSQTLLGDETATFNITVTNIGDVPLTNVVVTDPQAPNCDATYPNLAVGASETYTCTLTNVTGDFTNVAVVAAEHPASPDPITDSDVADVEVIAPEIDIHKTPDTQTVVSGSDVTFTITVENTGDADLTNVVVTDAQAPACDATFATLLMGEIQTYDCTVTGVTSGFTNVADVAASEPSGGTVTDSDTADVTVIDPSISIDKSPDSQTILPNGDATFTITVTNTGDAELTNVTVTDPQAPNCDATFASLAAGASETYSCTLTGIAAGFTNVATVTAEDPLGNPVGDSDSADVVIEAPAIEITKTADTPVVVSGGDATFTITVTNIGTTPLTDVAVSDPLAPSCAATIGDLGVGGSTSYSCTVTGVTADFTNTASVVGTHPLNGTVGDDDSADVDVIAPAISITKDPATQQVLAGQDATFTITVENTGDVDLVGVIVTDALAPVCDNTIGALAVTEIVSYTCDVTAVSDFINTASVSGLDPLGNPVSDSDDAIVDVIAPDIQIEKTPDLQYVVTGDDVTFTITVTNTGDVDLAGVAVTDALAPACDATIGDLAAGVSTSYDCTVTGVTADFTNTAAVSGLDPLGNAVNDSDTADVDVIDPAISLTKDPATQQILSGQDANFTITVTNNGDSPLTNVIITDVQAPACDAVIPALGAGASTTVTCAASAVTSSFTNTASVVATHAAGGTVSDSDTADVEVLVPEVDIQKTPDLQVAGIGDTVTFDITVTNAGVVPLSNVTVTDALAPNCDATIGDLAVGGSTTYSCTLTVTADLTNTAVVDATDAAGNPASDSDAADVDVVAPAISIEKTPDNQSVVLNGTPTFTITVTNTGDVDLSNVVITDALAPACDTTFAGLAVGANETYTCDGTATAADFTNTADVVADSVVGPVSDSDTADVTVLVPAIDIQKTPDNQLVGPAGTATFTITVTNAGATPLTDVIVSDPLAPTCDATFATLPVGGVETYTCDVTGISGDFTNTASVTGDDPLGNPVTDSDTADVDFVDPAISIEKTPDLQTLLAVEDASFTITVTNTGDTDLTNVVITDPLAPGCEATFASLLIGASETVTCDVTAVAADFTNVASVTADTPLGTQVSDSDDALVDVVAPGVQIEKTPDSQQIHSGDDVTFTITVTNNGDQDLVDLTVTDALTPACDTTIAALAVGESTSYDCTTTGVIADFTNIAAVDGTDALGNPVSDSDDAAVDVINPAIDIQKTPDNQAVVINGTATFDITVTNTGDVDLTGVTVSDPAAPACDNVIGDLAVGESITYSCSLSGVASDFTNTASATGNDPLDAPVTDSDTADVTVLIPAIDIQKTPDLQQARAGDTVDFTITVTNAGATPLSNVTVTDALAPACDTLIGDLAVGESASFTCSMIALADDFTNTASVTGSDPLDAPVTDSDTADVDVIGPAISIEKSPDGQTVVTGGTATFTIEVTNTGDVDLTGVAVTDTAVPACDASIGDLAVGESASYTCSVSDVTADFTNTADVVGTDPIGETVSDSDTADVTVLVPGIDIQKTPDTQTVVEGDDATFTIIVTNTGQTDLFNVTVSDPLAPACDNVIGDLPVGSAPVTYTCTAAAAASFTNTATADAFDPLDNPVSDSDTADVVALVRSNINGTIAHDIAGDGTIDVGDLGLGGVDVTATWAGLDGVFGTADDEVFTTTTDGNGDYSFDLVPPGEYQIDVDTADLPAGVDFQTLDPDATLDSATTLTLPEGTTYPDVDFAYTATGSIGDLVWLDLNDDGVQDPGEPGLGGIGVTVTWLGPDGVPGGGDDLVFATTTAPDGSYLVDGLPAGEFTVIIDGIPAGLSGDLDRTVTLGAAEARTDVDFPLVGTGSIGDQVFEDLNRDGVFDGGEPGVSNVTVDVTWAGPDGVIGTSDDVVFTTVTDDNGQYLVDGLPAGEYLVEIDETTIPADLGTAPPVTVSLPGGGSDLTADFPLVGNRPPVAVDDEDVTDEDTPVVITVLDDDSDPDGHSFAISTTTDPANGSIVVNPDGTITYTPDPGFVGVDTFTYTICELDGVVGGIPATGLCDTATVTVTIVEVNEPPGPEASFQSVVVGDPLSPMPVFDPDGGPVTVTYISGELPPGITLNPDGTFDGVTEEIGTYQVIVEVCDDDDPQICIIHTHTIAVTPLTLPGPGDDPDPDDPPDTLPFTGANFGDLLLAALVMLTAGAAMVLYSRRRTLSVPPRSNRRRVL
ncbi:MAG: SdrD B-like domain-containing protein [Acidimicrobiia bacterium]|nr:SdrD B-like domain-containing protein [Acidimicrobiia bacterium]